MRSRNFGLASVAAIACLLLLVGAAGAKPGFVKTPTFHTVQLLPTRGTHGYSIAVDVLNGRASLTATSLSAAGNSVVLYRQTGKRYRGDDLDLDFGKAATIKARFVADEVKREKAPKGCVGGSSLAEFGYFVGSFSFEGAGGFTSLHTHRLKGAIGREPSLVCHQLEGESRSTSKPVEGALRVVAGDPTGPTRFYADAEPEVAGFPATSTYSASTRHREGPVEIFEEVEAPAPAPLAIPDVTGALPGTVTLEPPAPFSGSATLEAPSRSTATWSGDLAVDFPRAGEIPLTGPGIAAGLCRDYTCSGSLPKALRPQPPKYGLGLDIQEIR